MRAHKCELIPFCITFGLVYDKAVLILITEVGCNFVMVLIMVKQHNRRRS